MNHFKQLNILVLILVLGFGFSSANSAQENDLIGCINNYPIYKTEYDRLLSKDLDKFKTEYIFDPWKNASVDDFEKRKNLIEKLKKQNSLFIPSTASQYHYEFSQKQKQFGNPLHTYDLNSYAEENALLTEFFQQNNQKKIQNKLIDKALLLQEAKAHNLNIMPWEIETALQKVKTKYSNPYEFQEFLRLNNANEFDLRNSLEEQILIDKLGSEKENWANWLIERKNKSQIEFSLTGLNISQCGNSQQIESQIINAPSPKVNLIEAKDKNENKLNKLKFWNKEGKNKNNWTKLFQKEKI
jgi:SurA N-terminal domain